MQQSVKYGQIHIQKINTLLNQQNVKEEPCRGSGKDVSAPC